MGFFRSSSPSPKENETVAAPNRAERQRCWTHRDAYFACLSSKNVVIPPGTDMSDGRADAASQESARKKVESRTSDPCLDERNEYEAECARSWVEYFNKRRVLEERQRLMREQGATPINVRPNV